jgi:hypothetical protein
MAKRPSESGDDEVYVTAGCERCGLWHDLTLRKLGPNSALPDEVRPVCWVCGHRPLVVIASGRKGS